MRVLVTGGYGYVGGRLVQALAGDAAFVVTAASRGAQPARSRVLHMTVDWSDDASIAALCRDQDAVVHLAAMNESDSERDPVGALRRNGLATLVLLRAAALAGLRRFIYLSTSKVFGDNPSGTIDERSLPHPGSHYAITHRLAEDYVLAAGRASALKTVVVRLSNGVGAPADSDVNAWSPIANDFCRQAAVTGRIVLRSSGVAWRNFIGMSDVVAALRHVLTVPAERLDNGLFHLGGPSSMRIHDLALAIAKRAQTMFGRDVGVERPQPSAGEHTPVLDWRIDKLAATGWSPAQNLDGEIDATLRLCAAGAGGHA
jgi:UDP-glucose 4-epimerase